MPRIDLDLNTDLMVTDDGYLTLRISPDEGNSLSIESDGLMSVGSMSVTGWNSKSGQILEGLTIGQVSFYNKETSNPTGRIAATGIVHRVFTSHGEKPGEELTGRMSCDPFRFDMDYCLPGDIFRVSIDNDDNYDYYLILKVDPRKEGDKYEPGNKIARYVKLGTFGHLSESDDEWTPVEKPDEDDIATRTVSGTIGGSDVVAYDDLDHVNIGDRVVIDPEDMKSWLTTQLGETPREISDFEYECVWHVASKIPSDLDLDTTHIRSFNKLRLEKGVPYHITASDTRVQYRIFSYSTSGQFWPASTTDWKSLNPVYDNPDDYDTDVFTSLLTTDARFEFRNNDGSAINVKALKGLEIYTFKKDDSTESQEMGPKRSVYTFTDFTIEAGGINPEDGTDTNTTPGGDVSPTAQGHYELLRYKPKMWDTLYSSYYEWIPPIYEKIPDTTVETPEFSGRDYYEQKSGYECVYDAPKNWEAPGEYKNYYTREYHSEPIIRYELNSLQFESGKINDMTGEKVEDALYIRSKFNSHLPEGRYKVWMDVPSETVPRIQMNVYVYRTSDNRYYSSQSELAWRYSGNPDLILEQESVICIVLRRDDYDQEDAVAPVMDSTVYIQKYPTANADTVTEDEGYYKSYEYHQLTSTTTFVSGEFYKEADVYDRLITKPDDWDRNFLKYYTLEPGKYEKVSDSASVPEFIIGKYYDLVFDNVAGGDRLVFEEGNRCAYLRDVYKAPALQNSDLTKDTLVRLSNAEYWDKGTPCWSYSESTESSRDLSSLVSPPNMTYENGSLDVFYGTSVNGLTDRIRSTGYVLLAEDATHPTNDQTFVLNATGATHVCMFVYIKTGESYDYLPNKSITDWRSLPFTFKGFDNAFTFVRFVFKNGNETTFTPESLTGVTLVTNSRTVTESEPYTTEEMFSIWYIKDDTVASDATRVTIARKTSTSSEEIIRENVLIKCLDLYVEVASIVELYPGDMVTIADNATVWADGEVITDEEIKFYTYQVIARDYQTKLFKLNNGKEIQREYLNKISRIMFNTELTPIDINQLKPIYPSDDDDEEEGGDG